MTALDPREIERLSKFINLLGSDRDGEVVAAARKGRDFLAERNLSWCDVTNMLKHPPVVIQPEPATCCHQSDADRCLRSDVSWKAHERLFLNQMATQRRAPSEKQQSWLDGLVDRAAKAEREASCDF